MSKPIPKVSVCLTACNRVDLLEVTLDSFFKYNTYPIEKFIVIEDSCINCNEPLKPKYPQVTWIDNPIKLGQWASIDRAYSLIDTEYIFHCEEDWEFYNYGFIEQSIQLLEAYPNYITVWLRADNDTNGHLIENEKIKHPIEHRLISTDHNNVWSGFTFNPGLRRLKDYKAIAPYSQFHLNNLPYAAEASISAKYKYLGFRAAIINSEGFVKHIGWKAHVNKTVEYKSLGIIVPYRDREQHLNNFIPHIHRYLNKIGISNYTITVVEQYDDKPFNRAKLLNVGAKLTRADYYVFHDVDMLPIDVDYSYTTLPTHLASKCSQFGYKMPYPEYFGGVTMVTKELFELVNGFSNEYWGWGAEDDDFRNRILKTVIPIMNRVGVFESQDHKPSINLNLEANRAILKEGTTDGVNDVIYHIVEDSTSSYRHIKVIA